MNGCGMDRMRDEAGSSINRAHVSRTSGRLIWISASRGDGIRGQGESSRTRVVGAKSVQGLVIWKRLFGAVSGQEATTGTNYLGMMGAGTDSSPGRLSGITTKDLFFGDWLGSKEHSLENSSGGEHSG